MRFYKSLRLHSRVVGVVVVVSVVVMLCVILVVVVSVDCSGCRSIVVVADSVAKSYTDCTQGL